MINKLKEWICHPLYKDHPFNSDMNIDIDLLVQEYEKLKVGRE